MPKVGKKHFPYTEEGYAKAAALADKTGKTVETGYAAGGEVKFAKETYVEVPEGPGGGTARGMGAATKGGKFEGAF